MAFWNGRKIHFIGVGGMGVNALARYALDCGAAVSGSDAKLNGLCSQLARRGAKIYEGTDVSAVDCADTVVYSSAIHEDNKELMRARALRIPALERQQFLHKAAEDFPQIVGIAGTHGKTTTTAMLVHILSLCGKNFVGMIGGESVDYGNYVNNISEEGDGIFLTEACEYKRNFLSLKPTVALVTNVECDHPDSYENYDSVRAAFDEYLSGGKIKIYAADGFERYDFAVVAAEDGRVRRYDGKIGQNDCGIYSDGRSVCSINLRDACTYNYKNAAFAIAAAESLGVDPVCAVRALGTFGGVKRRFEYVGSVSGRSVYFDFAHHPTEIKCVLERAKAFGRILAVFQPHTYTRTKAYFADFVEALKANEGDLVLMPTYAAREQMDTTCEFDVLASAIKRYGKCNVYAAPNGDYVLKYVQTHASDHDIILFIGAGDIYDLKDKIQFEKPSPQCRKMSLAK